MSKPSPSFTGPLAIDCETHLISAGPWPGGPCPKMVCVSWAYEAEPGQVVWGVCSNAPEDEPLLLEFFQLLLSAPLIVGHRTSYDMGVIAKSYPEVDSAIWDLYDQCRVTDTLLREKLLNLSTHGHLDEVPAPDGTVGKISYHLSDLVKTYFGVDISASKKDDDSWRMNYSMLDGLPVKEWPDEAIEYAKDDAIYSLDVWKAQEEAKKNGGSTEPEFFRAMVDYALFRETCEGFEIDEAARDKIAADLSMQLSPERMRPLYDAGMVRPAEPPRQHKRSKDPSKLTKGKPESVDMAVLRSLIEKVCSEHSLPVLKTETGQTCTAEIVLGELKGLNATLDLYASRQEVQKLITTEIPRLSAGLVRPCYDSLKETGRTSSYASKLYPSVNIQNVDPRVRHCYRARKGWLLASVDYSALELVSAAQKMLWLFGKSRLADLINSGKDPHAFLGALLAAHMDENFANLAEEAEIDDEMQLYDFFMACKKSKAKEAQEFYSRYRTFAKPTGLGFPGGLGAATFVDYAKATYGVDLVKLTGSRAAAEDLGKRFKEVWFDAYPEFRNYFEWVNTCIDPNNPETSYSYVSPLGMVRAGATFCAAANGAALQTPSAEGALLGVWEVVRRCYDKSLSDTLLLGCRPLAFIHDQQIVEVPDDSLAHDRTMEISKIMIDSMSKILPDMQIRTESLLMREWHKEAKPVYDTQGRLVPWTPK